MRHSELLARLKQLPERTWGQQALLVCLRRLRDGGPTEAAIVEVYEAWPLDDGFKIVYLSPWGPIVGLTARREKLQFFSCIYQDDEGDITPEAFGKEIADFFVGEPLGNYVDVLSYDDEDLGWWGADHAVL
jgi:hypothetical protein